MNRYLRDKAMRGDMRNPYGSRGGYVSSRRGRRDRADMNYEMEQDMARGRRGRTSRGRSRTMDYEYDYPERDGRYDSRYDYGQEYSRDYMGDQHYGEHHRPMEYEMYGIGGMRPMYDYRGRMDYGYDYASEDMEKEYKEDLEEWKEKLKKHDRFNFSKEQIISQAKQMGVKFEEFSEDEFLVVYYMVLSDYPSIANEPHTYLAMAKDWLHDKDSELQGSEKLCAYYYEVIKGGKD